MSLSNEALARALRSRSAAVEPLLEALQALDWVGLLNEAETITVAASCCCATRINAAVPLLDGVSSAP